MKEVLLTVFLFAVTPFFIWKLSMVKQINIKQPVTSVVTPTVISQKTFFVKGSIPYWDQENALNDFKNHVENFNYINLFWYYLGQDGMIQKYEYANEDRSIIAFAHENNVKVSAVITNLPDYSGAGWNSGRVENILINDEMRQSHIQNIVNKLRDYNFDGVIIDYELVRPSARDKFTNYVRELKEALRPENKILTVVLHPKTGENVDNEKIGVFQDWKGLSVWADQLQIMGYSEHTDTDPSGPIASLPWVGKIIAYLESLNIPKDKLFLGIPLYGYDWNKDNDTAAEDLTFNDVRSLLSTYGAEEKWDNIRESPYFTYTKNGRKHEVWFENAKSVLAKVNIAKNAGLAGVTFWRLGEEDPEVWESLKSLR